MFAKISTQAVSSHVEPTHLSVAIEVCFGSCFRDLRAVIGIAPFTVHPDGIVNKPCLGPKLLSDALLSKEQVRALEGALKTMLYRDRALRMARTAQRYGSYTGVLPPGLAVCLRHPRWTQQEIRKWKLPWQH